MGDSRRNELYFYQQKNHHYFDLVEKGEPNGITARLNAVAFLASHNKIREFERATGQRFTNDIHVLLNVSVEFHPQYGLKLIVVDVDPNFTLGAIELQRQATLQSLVSECANFVRKEGDIYITRNKTLKLSIVLQEIAVFTSSNSTGVMK